MKLIGNRSLNLKGFPLKVFLLVILSSGSRKHAKATEKNNPELAT